MAALVAVLLLAITACKGDNGRSADGGQSGGASAGPGVPRPDTSKTFGWTEFGSEADDGDNGTVELGSIRVPIDYSDPSAGTFDLFIARHLATDPEHRLGSLVVNPGGPGFGASDFAIYAAQNYGKDLLARFDIVGWDPRGTGLSTPAIDCIDDYDRYFAAIDITPDDAAERQQAVDRPRELEDDCVEKNGDILDHIGTNDSARDIDTVRKALGESTISYFGFSYGSELGATWATMFPTTVRAAVLDGAVDPNADLPTQGLEQAKGFERSLSTFLARCSDDDGCAFHNDGDAEGAYDRLMTQLDKEPIPSEPGRPDVNLQVLTSAAAQAMYLKQYWPLLEQALADAQNGDGKGLLALYDAYYMREADGTYPNTLEAYQSIFCMDRAERPTVAEDDAATKQLREVAPRLSPATVGGYQCTFFPPSTSPRIPITGAGAGPVLVVGTTGDPATPLAGSQAMADALEGGELLTVVGDQHTGYGVNDCSVETIESYLIDLTMPAKGTRCE